MPGEFHETNIIRLAGTVRKVIDRSVLNEPRQVQISFAGADYLYDELRIPNIHKWEVGEGIEVTIRPRPSGAGAQRFRCV